MFLDSDFLKGAKISRFAYIFKADIGLLNICMGFMGFSAPIGAKSPIFEPIFARNFLAVTPSEKKFH